METLSRKDFEELRKKIEPIKKLAFHNDADGVSSAVLLSYIFKINKVFSPSDFGEWPIQPYSEDGKQEFPPDACVDMIPQNPNWVGLCLDHHPGHPEENKRAYQLIYGNVPTGVLAYLVFKNQIPKEQIWKVAVSAVGDGQPEVIPTEIWRENPVLLEEAISTWEKYGKRGIQTAPLPLYIRLTSGINAACKIPGKWYIAYSVLRNAKNPWDLLKDTSLNTAKEFLRDERKRILSDFKPIQLRSGIRLWVFESETSLERTLAWELWEKDMKTIVALNTKTGRGSIRGVLATLIYEHLSLNGMKASGHPGFGGLRLKPGQTPEDLYKILSNLRI